MPLLDDLRLYARFGLGLPGFLRQQVSLAQARDIVRQRLQERDANFLRVMERAVYGHPRSPYLRLLRAAGCAFGDLRNHTRTHGLDATLRHLRESGVYVTFEEFKGRTPIVRGGLSFQPRAEDFDNPFPGRGFAAHTSGSTGAGTRVVVDVDNLAAQTPNYLLAWEARDLMRVPFAMWLPLPPFALGLNFGLKAAKSGNPPQEWFTPVSPSDPGMPWRYWLATRYAVLLSRTTRHPLPLPRQAPLSDPSAIVDWMRRSIDQHGRCHLHTYVSNALRVSLAAQKAGVNLAGATIMSSGEPATASKMAGIRACGAAFASDYGFSEAGHVATACAAGGDGVDYHFFADAFALLQHPIPVPGLDIEVEVFHFTTLLPTAPKILLNTAIDDYGVVEQRSCGCSLEAHGLTTHISQVRSYRKFNAEAMTLPGAELIRILETVLPQRFGGSPLDYQFSEVEDAQGLTRLRLSVSPRIPLPSTQDVVDTVIAALQKSSAWTARVGSMLQQAGSLQVVQEEPRITAAGKLLPLQIGQKVRSP